MQFGRKLAAAIAVALIGMVGAQTADAKCRRSYPWARYTCEVSEVDREELELLPTGEHRGSRYPIKSV